MLAIDDWSQRNIKRMRIIKARKHCRKVASVRATAGTEKTIFIVLFWKCRPDVRLKRIEPRNGAQQDAPQERRAELRTALHHASFLASVRCMGSRNATPLLAAKLDAGKDD